MAERKGRKAAPKRKKQVAEPELPNVGGDEVAFRVLVRLWERADEQIAEYEAVRFVHGHELDDPVAGLPPVDGEGYVNSYRRFIDAIRAEQQRLAEWRPHLTERLRAAVAERDGAA